MRFAAKVDRDHAAVRDVLRELGWLVLDTARLRGFVDLVATKAGRVALIEVKTPQSATGRLRRTRRQVGLLAQGWPIVTLRSAEDAMRWAMQEGE